jgi:hypothetical protein
MADLRWLNKKYKDLGADTRTDLGNVVKVQVDVSPQDPGAQGDKPQFKWVVTRALGAAQARSLVDPVLADKVERTRSWGQVVDRHTLRMTLPMATGVTYTVEAMLGAKVVKTFTPFVTWRRYYLDVTAEDDYALAQYRKGLPLLQQWFALAHCKLIENVVKVKGKAQPVAAKDHSEKGLRGKVIPLALGLAKWDEFDLKQLVKFADGACKTTVVKFEGTKLALKLPSKGAVWYPHMNDPERPKLQTPLVTQVVARRAGVEFVKMYYRDTEGPGRATLNAAALRESDQRLLIDLDQAGLKPALAAIRAGEAIEFDLCVNGKMFGRQAGEQQGEAVKASYFFWPEAEAAALGHPITPATIAALLAHELGHAFSLTQKSKRLLHAVAGTRFELVAGAAQVAREQVPAAEAAGNEANPLWYDHEEGGVGSHCSKGSVTQDSELTTRRIAHVLHATDKACVMFDSTNDRPLATGFCETCQGFLRMGLRS